MSYGKASCGCTELARGCVQMLASDAYSSKQHNDILGWIGYICLCITIFAILLRPVSQPFSRSFASANFLLLFVHAAINMHSKENVNKQCNIYLFETSAAHKPEVRIRI